MKKKLLLLFILGFFTSLTYSQSFEVETSNQFVQSQLNDEVIFTMEIINTGTQNLSVYIKRTANNIPTGWSSSLCFTFCFSPAIDSIATTRDFGSSPIEPGDTAEVSLHIFTDANPDSGNVSIKIASLDNPSVFYDFQFRTSSIPNNVENEEPVQFVLHQNYPNPFNPTTTIEYSIPNVGTPVQNVQLKIYDVLGREIATLVNEKQSPGDYSVKFDASKLNSGVYFYTLQAGDFIATKKMILIK